MGKILLTNYSGEVKIQYPKELIFLFKQSKSRWLKNLITFDNESGILKIITTDMEWSKYSALTNIGETLGSRDRRKSQFTSLGYISNYIRNTVRYADNILAEISFYVKKGKGFSICEKMELDYTIYQNPENEILIISNICLNEVPINSNSTLIRNSRSDLQRELCKVVPNLHSNIFYSAIKEVNEIYYFKRIEENDIVYVTKDKFAFAGYHKQNVDSKSLHRKMSISKFFKLHFPDIAESTVNAYIEYNKMLSVYDPSLFSIVSGDDIIKYYLEENYFKKSGELGTSCMRDSSKSHVINFYANNSNFRLLIMKAGQTDAIMARALLVTTTDGTVFMDRIYTVDTKVIGSFHKYAEENGIKNIYNYREHNSSTKNLFTMGPVNWTKRYDDNYKVDLEWIPKKITALKEDLKYQAALYQNSAITSNYDLPYIDNFQYINAFTKQASVNPLNFFVACELSGELVDNAHVYYCNDKVYDRRFVDTHMFSTPTLKIDTVTLDSSDTPQAGDDDIDEADEDFNWDDDDLDNDDLESEQEVEENPFTIAALNENGIINSVLLQAYGNLTPEAMARLIDAASPNLRVILDQINDIVTDSQQQEQHLFQHNV